MRVVTDKRIGHVTVVRRGDRKRTGSTGGCAPHFLARETAPVDGYCIPAVDRGELAVVETAMPLPLAMRRAETEREDRRYGLAILGVVLFTAGVVLVVVIALGGR